MGDRTVDLDPNCKCDGCGKSPAYDFMGDFICHDCMHYPVTCARCGKVGDSHDFIVEEGDEWECPPCWERCNAAERAALQGSEK